MVGSARKPTTSTERRQLNRRSVALLAVDLVLSATELATEMADEVSRLATLRYGGGADAPSVAAA